VHELSLGQAIVETVCARSASPRDVRRVTVRIGHLRQVVPESLLFAWGLLTEDSDLAGCSLEIEHVPAVVQCRGCGASTTLDLPLLLCGSCSSDDVELVAGEEFLLVSMDVAQEVR
jgi:hydrogenase nickel incorporation protein HypA/HybF